MNVRNRLLVVSLRQIIPTFASVLASSSRFWLLAPVLALRSYAETGATGSPVS